MLREVERADRRRQDDRHRLQSFQPVGLWRLFGRWRGGIPWCGHFLPSAPERLADADGVWYRTHGCHGIPATHAQRSVRCCGAAGAPRGPMLAGIYVVRAVKRVSRVTPVRQHWSRLRVLGPRAIEPTAREVNDV